MSTEPAIALDPNWPQVSLKDATTGRVVGAARNCDDLTFEGDAATRTANPAALRRRHPAAAGRAGSARRRRYVPARATAAGAAAGNGRAGAARARHHVDALDSLVQ